jgi:hypothetical protein
LTAVAEDGAMERSSLDSLLAPVRRGTARRFMESSDINAAFGLLYESLRAGIRRGLTNEGQLYALEMDACVPGEMLGAQWIPPVTRGVCDARALAQPARRRAVLARLLAERRAESLVAYVCEQPSGPCGATALLLEITSPDGIFAAEFPITRGRGWYRRDLLPRPHRRVAA